MDSYLVGSLDAITFMLSASFFAYVVMITWALLRRRHVTTGDDSQFDWHFFIPCLNEELVLEATVADMFRKFPAAHIWCIDDASTDGTARVLARMAARSKRVHVVTRQHPDAQVGKGPALNSGWRALSAYLPPGTDRRRVVVGVVDADGVLDENCLKFVTGPTFFGNPEVDAVQIKVRVVDPGPTARRTARIITRMQDLEFTCVIAAMQALRRHAGSAGMGGNGQFTRMATLDRIAEAYHTPWQRALIEDFELGLHVLLTGGRTDYCHDTWVAQQGPPTLARLIRQRSRWAQGMMQCFRYVGPILRCPQITTAAALEITYFLFLPWFQLGGLLVYTTALLLFIYGLIVVPGGPGHWFGSGAWGLIPLFLLFGLAPIVFWGPIYRRTQARGLSWWQGWALGFANWPYTYVHHISTWWAFARVLRSRHDWKKTEREAVPALPRARPARPVAVTTGRAAVAPRRPEAFALASSDSRGLGVTGRAGGPGATGGAGRPGQATGRYRASGTDRATAASRSLQPRSQPIRPRTLRPPVPYGPPVRASIDPAALAPSHAPPAVAAAGPGGAGSKLTLTAAGTLGTGAKRRSRPLPGGSADPAGADVAARPAPVVVGRLRVKSTPELASVSAAPNEGDRPLP